MYNSGKPWGKYGAVYYQQHVVNWRELLVWIHKNSIDVDRHRTLTGFSFTIHHQLKWVRVDTQGIQQMDQPYMIYGFGGVRQHRFRVHPEVIF